MLAAPARVAILATLANGQPWLFADLKVETGLADGNLHVQTRKLLKAGYIGAEKVNPKGRRVTRFQLAELGRKALRTYLEQIAQAINQQGQAPGLGRSKPPARKDDDSRVW